MQPGLWEISFQVEAPGMPAGMGGHTLRQCIRASDLASPEKTLPQQQGGQCRIEDYKLSGNTASWKIACSGEGRAGKAADMSGSGSITYSSDRYSGSSQMTVREGGQAMTMTQRFAGKRIGDCQ